MEALAYLHSYSSYEEAEGIEYDFSNFEFKIPQIPSSQWLSLLGISILYSSLSIAVPASAGYIVKTNGNCLNTRWGPGVEFEYAGICVRNGAALKPVVEWKNGWAKLSSGRWVSGNYIQQSSTNGNQEKSVRSAPQTIPSPSTPTKAQAGYVVKTNGSCLNTRWGPGVEFGQAGICVPNGTKLATQNFQIKYGLTPDGIVGTKTLAKLRLD